MYFMQDLPKKLDNVELKLRQLALKMERLENDNAALLEENQQLKAATNKNHSKVSALEQRLKKTQEALELKRSNDPEGTQKMRKEIDKCIQEIDKCIQWISAN